MIEVTLQFQSIEAAQAALAKLGGAATTGYMAPASAPAAPVYQPPAQPAFAPAQPAYNGPLPTQPAYAPPAAPAAYAPPAPPAAALGGITLQQVIGAMQAYSKVHKAAGTKAALAQFGATDASSINPAYYPQVIEALRLA